MVYVWSVEFGMFNFFFLFLRYVVSGGCVFCFFSDFFLERFFYCFLDVRYCCYFCVNYYCKRYFGFRYFSCRFIFFRDVYYFRSFFYVVRC